VYKLNADRDLPRVLYLQPQKDLYYDVDDAGKPFEMDSADDFTNNLNRVLKGELKVFS
jgi:hypothetical protein